QVGELDAVLTQQPARCGHEGDDRLVRVDQVRVRRPRVPAIDPGLPPPAPVSREAARSVHREPAVHAYEAQIAVHRPLLVVYAGAEKLAGALLRAALAARVAELASLGTPAGPGP